ncbi:MAG: hypothetical protein M1818_003772 [Claussenomyces sp. TS43310]|nr:MAG: hypothetical protein M1818_003772 [Claussenomyces sp. TS43310]
MLSDIDTMMTILEKLRMETARNSGDSLPTGEPKADDEARTEALDGAVRELKRLIGRLEDGLQAPRDGMPGKRSHEEENMRRARAMLVPMCWHWYRREQVADEGVCVEAE